MSDHNNESAWGLAQRFAAAPACDDQCGSVYVTLGVVTVEQRGLIVEALRASLETQKSPPTQ